MSTSSWRKLVLGYLAIGAVSVPVADIAFRAIGDRPSRDLTGLYEQWADSSYRLARAVQTSAEFYSGPMEVFTDSLGLRTGADRSRWHRRGESTDVLLLGDSQTFGNNLNWPETIGGQLDSIAATVGWRVANAGTGAHLLANQIDVARSLIYEDSLVPRHIVVLFTPLLMSRPGKRNRARVGEDGRLYGGEMNAVRRTTMWLKMNTTVYNRARGAFRYLRETLITRDSESETHDLGAIELYAKKDNVDERADSIAVYLAELRELASSTGASLHVGYLPSTIEASPTDLLAAAKATGVEVDVHRPTEILSRATRAAAVELIDLRPALDSAMAQKHPLTVVADPHYSAPLSAFVARLLWNGIHSQLTRDSVNGPR